MSQTSEMMRVRTATKGAVVKLAESDDKPYTTVAAAAVEAFQSLPIRERREAYKRVRKSKRISVVSDVSGRGKAKADKEASAA